VRHPTASLDSTSLEELAFLREFVSRPAAGAGE
jgi:hypothetical protein